jgi:hypothetical protein
MVCWMRSVPCANKSSKVRLLLLGRCIPAGKSSRQADLLRVRNHGIWAVKQTAWLFRIVYLVAGIVVNHTRASSLLGDGSFTSVAAYSASGLLALEKGFSTRTSSSLQHHDCSTDQRSARKKGSTRTRPPEQPGLQSLATCTPTPFWVPRRAG